MRVVLAAAIVASLATPAFAQQSHVPQYGETDKEKTTSQKAADKAAAEAYKRSLGAIPDKGPSDPWGAVRSTEAPKPTRPRPRNPGPRQPAAPKPSRSESHRALPLRDTIEVTASPGDDRPDPLVQIIPGDLGDDLECPRSNLRPRPGLS